MGCNYLPLPLIPASGTKVINIIWCSPVIIFAKHPVKPNISIKYSNVATGQKRCFTSHSLTNSVLVLWGIYLHKRTRLYMLRMTTYIIQGSITRCPGKTAEFTQHLQITSNPDMNSVNSNELNKSLTGLHNKIFMAHTINIPHLSVDQNISLFHENKVVNDPAKVCNIFNDYFIEAASHIGKADPIQDDETIDDILCSYKDHTNIKRIISNVPHVSMFNFSVVSVKEVQKLLKDVDSQKATGYDNIPPKILKIAADELTPPLANLINLSVTKSNFPMDLKKSELSPLYKCKDSLMSENYHPLGVLTSLSKIFEKVFNQQIYDYFADVMSDLLSAFRKNTGVTMSWPS